MEASVIIVTKNQKKYLELTLSILKKQTTPCEIVVVDSGSTDGAQEYCRAQKVKVVDFDHDNFNFAQAFNEGAAESKGKYLIRLSGDCVPQGEDWVKTLITPFADPKVGGTFGRYIISGRKGYGFPDYWPDNRFPKELKRYAVKPYYFMGIGLFGLSMGKDIWEFAGGCCAIRKEVWNKRPFNETLLAGEDAEYSWFLHLIGYDIVCTPKAKSLHEHKINLLATTKNYLGFSKWSLVFNLAIWRYWVKRLLGDDPYKGMVYSNR